MLLKLLINITFIIFYLSEATMPENPLFEISDYQVNLSNDDDDGGQGEMPGIRNNFLKKKRQFNKEKLRLELFKLLEKKEKSNVILVDEIPHYKINKNMKKYKKVINIEKEYKTLITMKGVKYYYKKDKFWRTWRVVKYPKKKVIVNYRFQKMCNVTNEAEVCNDVGLWLIEEKPPPCPFEIFSMKRKGVYCAVKNTQLHKEILNHCPMTIRDADITGICENPIITEWQFEKDFSEKPKRKYLNILSKGRQHFELTTVYMLSPDEVTFRIVNSSNNIIYSRIMKKNRRNYACVESCGVLDSDQRRVIKKEKPMTVDLLNPKKKRENSGFKSSNMIAEDKNSKFKSKTNKGIQKSKFKSKTFKGNQNSSQTDVKRIIITKKNCTTTSTEKRSDSQRVEKAELESTTEPIEVQYEPVTGHGTLSPCKKIYLKAVLGEEP